jgi:hypothetical protein
MISFARGIFIMQLVAYVSIFPMLFYGEWWQHQA